MMRTITLDVMNEKVMDLLQDLEQLELIRLHEASSKTDARVQDLVSRYKGAMTRQSPDEIEAQLKQLRDEWE